MTKLAKQKWATRALSFSIASSERATLLMTRLFSNAVLANARSNVEQLLIDWVFDKWRSCLESPSPGAQSLVSLFSIYQLVFPGFEDALAVFFAPRF